MCCFCIFRLGLCVCLCVLIETDLTVGTNANEVGSRTAGLNKNRCLPFASVCAAIRIPSVPTFDIRHSAALHNIVIGLSFFPVKSDDAFGKCQNRSFVTNSRRIFSIFSLVSLRFMLEFAQNLHRIERRTRYICPIRADEFSLQFSN